MSDGCRDCLTCIDFLDARRSLRLETERGVIIMLPGWDADDWSFYGEVVFMSGYECDPTEMLVNKRFVHTAMNEGPVVGDDVQ